MVRRRTPPRQRAGRAAGEQVRRPDVQEWIAWLLGRYSPAYASNQFRALQQFFRWLAAEEEIPDPVAGLLLPHVADKPVPALRCPTVPGQASIRMLFRKERDNEGYAKVSLKK